MTFDGDAFADRFNRVWNAHDVDGILAMMTDDVVFEASFGTDPWGTRVIGRAGVRQFLKEMSGTPNGGARFEVEGCDVLSLREGKIAAKRSYRKGRV